MSFFFRRSVPKPTNQLSSVSLSVVISTALFSSSMISDVAAAPSQQATDYLLSLSALPVRGLESADISGPRVDALSTAQSALSRAAAVYAVRRYEEQLAARQYKSGRLSRAAWYACQQATREALGVLNRLSVTSPNSVSRLAGSSLSSAPQPLKWQSIATLEAVNQTLAASPQRQPVNAAAISGGTPAVTVARVPARLSIASAERIASTIIQRPPAPVSNSRFAPSAKPVSNGAGNPGRISTPDFKSVPLTPRTRLAANLSTGISSPVAPKVLSSRSGQFRTDNLPTVIESPLPVDLPSVPVAETTLLVPEKGIPNRLATRMQDASRQQSTQPAMMFGQPKSVRTTTILPATVSPVKPSVMNPQLATKTADRNRLLLAQLDSDLQQAQSRLDGARQDLDEGERTLSRFTNTLRAAMLEAGPDAKGLHPFVRTAQRYAGTPYVWGGESARGFDCSGFIIRVMRDLGYRALPHSAAEQFNYGKPIAQALLKPGDLVFFANTYKPGISHVGIFLGRRRFIHAAGTGKGTIVSLLDDSSYQAKYAGARRLVAAR